MNLDFVSSNRNNNVQYIRNLGLKKVRQEERCYFLEGLRAVRECLEANVTIRKMVVSRSFTQTEAFNELIKEYGAERFSFFAVTDQIYNFISDTQNPQGIGVIAEFEKPRRALRSLEQTLGFEVNNVLVLEDVRDPGNMGTVLRTADAAGFDCVISAKNCVDIYNPKVLRSAVGSVYHLPVLQGGTTFHCGEESSAKEIIYWLKVNGFTVYATSPLAGQSCFETDFKGKTAVLIGNEANGLSDDVFKMCDVTLNIPMPGKAESLNASVAAALLMYEVARKKLI